MTPPLLSHTAFWQLPMASGSAVVPAAAFENPQVFWLPHTRVWQIESAPGQSVARSDRPRTRALAELPLHSVRAALPRTRCAAARADATGIPFTHVSSVQALPSSAGVSLSQDRGHHAADAVADVALAVAGRLAW